MPYPVAAVRGKVLGGDTTRPTCVITASVTTITAAVFTCTFTFSEDVTGFEVGDITVGNGIAGTFNTVSGSVYTAVITPIATGNVTVDVGAGVCADAAGNTNTSSNTFSILHVSAAAWFDFSDISTLYQTNTITSPVTADGQAIGYASDKSGSGNHITQSSAPSRHIYKTNIQNSKSVARGNATYLTKASFVVAQPLTLIMAISNTTEDRVSIGGGGGIGVYRAGAKWAYQAGNFLQGTIAPSSFDIVSAVFDGASSRLRVNGSVASTSNPGAAGFLALGVGAYSTGGNPAVGDIGEVFVFSSALSLAQYQAIEAYLNTKWAVF
jgi:hypothetical protein